ncbi:hypothetical protein WBG06_16220 [Nocardioides sp. CCNWLW239]|uniref:hypothetical protein n=1 Tax=Nocardioides sp. CCNWLW239 TaxID=3128902 RepID=UPI0030199777
MSHTEGASESPSSDIPESNAAPPRRSSVGRSVAAVVCLVLAALLVTPAAVAYWGQRTLNDEVRYIETVGPLVESPEVQDAIATKVTEAIQQQVDVEALLTTAFAELETEAPRVELLIGPMSGAVNGLIEREVRRFIASDEFADLWIRINSRAQQALHRILTGDNSGAVSLQGDQVVLDLDDVITLVKERLVERGLTVVEKVPIPETERQIVLMDAPQLRQARTIYAFSNPVAKWMLPVVGVLFLGAVLLARRRARMTVWVGAVIAANALLLGWTLSVGQQLFVNQLAGTTFGPASKVFYQTLLAYLERAQDAVLLLGLIIVVAGLFAGANRYGSAVRNAVSSTLVNAGTNIPTSQVSAVGRWIEANAGWLRVAVVALGVVVLVWGNQVTTGRVWWSLALVLVLLACLQVLIGAGRADKQAHSEPHPAVE